MSVPTNISRTLEAIIAELAVRLRTYTSFEVSSFVRIFNTQEGFNQAFFEDASITYPFITYQTKNLSLAVDRMGSVIARKKNVPLSKVTIQPYPQPNLIEYAVDVTGLRVKQTDMIPVDYEVTFNFITNTPQQFDEFLMVWLNTYPQVAVDIVLTDNIRLPTSFIPNIEGISYPEKEVDDRGEHYRGEVTCSVRTFIGGVSDVPFVQEIAAPATLAMDTLKDEANQTLANVIKISNT